MWQLPSSHSNIKQNKAEEPGGGCERRHTQILMTIPFLNPSPPQEDQQQETETFLKIKNPHCGPVSPGGPSVEVSDAEGPTDGAFGPVGSTAGAAIKREAFDGNTSQTNLTTTIKEFQTVEHVKSSFTIKHPILPIQVPEQEFIPVPKIPPAYKFIPAYKPTPAPKTTSAYKFITDQEYNLDDYELIPDQKYNIDDYELIPDPNVDSDHKLIPVQEYIPGRKFISDLEFTPGLNFIPGYKFLSDLELDLVDYELTHSPKVTSDNELTPAPNVDSDHKLIPVQDISTTVAAKDGGGEDPTGRGKAPVGGRFAATTFGGGTEAAADQKPSTRYPLIGSDNNKCYSTSTPAPNNCRAYEPRWAFNINSRKCEPTSRCRGGPTFFDTLSECEHACKDLLAVDKFTTISNSLNEINLYINLENQFLCETRPSLECWSGYLFNKTNYQTVEILVTPLYDIDCIIPKYDNCPIPLTQCFYLNCTSKGSTSSYSKFVYIFSGYDKWMNLQITFLLKKGNYHSSWQATHRLSKIDRLNMRKTQLLIKQINKFEYISPDELLLSYTDVSPCENKCNFDGQWETIKLKDINGINQEIFKFPFQQRISLTSSSNGLPEGLHLHERLHEFINKNNIQNLLITPFDNKTALFIGPKTTRSVLQENQQLLTEYTLKNGKGSEYGLMLQPGGVGIHLGNWGNETAGSSYYHTQFYIGKYTLFVLDDIGFTSTTPINYEVGNINFDREKNEYRSGTMALLIPNADRVLIDEFICHAE
jgi:hypothetical protein